MKRLLFSLTILLQIPNLLFAQEFMSTGMADVDQIRKEVKLTPTSTENYDSRRAALARWWRLLWRQGYDMSAMKEASTHLLFLRPDRTPWMSSVDECFAILEEIHANPTKIPEVQGTSSVSGTKTNWPFYMGTDGSNTGFTPDSGPSLGRLLGKIPKSVHWTPKVIQENGKLYVSSPGPDVIGYCLDNRTGEIIWRARQYGFALYEDKGCYTTPVVSSDRVLFRNGGGSEAVVFDKESGEKLEPEKSSFREFFAYGSRNGWVFVVDAATFEGFARFRTPAAPISDPVVDGDLIYVAARDGSVFCFNGRERNQVWAIQLDSKLIGSVELADGRLLVGSETGILYCLDAKSGREIWSWESREKSDHTLEFFSKTMTTKERVFVGSASGHLFCLDVEDGRLMWEHQTDSWIRSRPLVIGKAVYVATLDGQVIGFSDEGSRGLKRWEIKLGVHGFVADLSGGIDGILASSRDFKLYSISPSDGSVQWRHPILDAQLIDGEFVSSSWYSGLMTTPTVVDDVLYVGGPDGFVNAFDAITGREKWKFEIGALTTVAPVVAEGKVFIGHLLDDGRFCALDKHTGKVIWESEEYGEVWVAPVYDDGMIFFGNIKGDMFGVRASDGEKIWSFATDDYAHPDDTKKGNLGVFSNPCQDEENVYVGSWAGSYYAINKKSGELLWQTRTMPSTSGGRPDSAAPMVHKGHLYVQKAAKYIAALDKHTGELKWEYEVPQGHLQNGTIAAYGDMIVGSHGRDKTKIPYDVTLVAFQDVETGSKKLWEYIGGGGLTAPVLTEDKVIFGSTGDVFITCLDRKTGDLKWRVFTGGELLENTPTIYGNRVYVHCKNGWIHAIE